MPGVQIENVRVLVVDDVAAMRQKISEILHEIGYRRIVTAVSGEQAVQLLEDGAFHLIVCDWHLRFFSGLEVLRFVRARPHLKDTSFVIVTVDNGRDAVLEAIRAGVDDYIVKPLFGPPLRERLHAVLTKRKVL